jgi:dienelactone hydrolase
MITFLLLYLLTLIFLNKTAEHRWDGSPALPYYSAADLGLKEERFSFYSGKWKLDTSRYYINKDGPYKGLMVVFHGIGAGRTAYMKAISSFAKDGYLVYAFDNTGSMRSEGPEIYGLGHVYKDLEAFYSYLDQDPKAQGLHRFSYGHSWGGYAALLSSQPSFKVEKIISLAGFVDETTLYCSLAKPLSNPIGRALLAVHRRFHEGTKVRNCFSFLESSNAKILYIQGIKDEMVSNEISGKVLQQRYGKNERFKFIFLPDRDHAVDCSKAAGEYRNALLKQGVTSLKAPKDLKLDLAKATESDLEIDKAIFDFLAH